MNCDEWGAEGCAKAVWKAALRPEEVLIKTAAGDPELGSAGVVAPAWMAPAMLPAPSTDPKPCLAGFSASAFAYAEGGSFEPDCSILENTMGKVRVAAFAISIDGFGAGPRQDLENPLGVRGPEIFAWFFATEVFRSMHGQEGGAQGIDNDFAAQSFENVGASILGRNMFGPVRGPWKDDEWKGWWGANPPFHTPVFVLTHHARAPLEMEGATTFHFVTDGIESAMAKAKRAAKGKDVRIGGGVSTVRQYLLADQIDEMHLALSPVLMGEGEHVFSGINLHERGFKVVRTVTGENATHLLISRT